MSWFESLLGKKKPKVNSSERNEPTLATPTAPTAEVAATAKAAEVQREADEREIEVIRARLNGELPASDQEHIDIPLEDEKKVALDNERRNQKQLFQYIVILKELQETVGERAPNELELSQPLLDSAFKKAAAAIKALDPHSEITELMIVSKLIVRVRNGNLAPYIATYERKHQESVRKIKELQGDRTSQIAQEAWGKKDS